MTYRVQVKVEGHLTHRSTFPNLESAEHYYTCLDVPGKAFLQESVGPAKWKTLRSKTVKDVPDHTWHGRVKTQIEKVEVALRELRRSTSPKVTSLAPEAYSTLLDRIGDLTDVCDKNDAEMVGLEIGATYEFEGTRYKVVRVEESKPGRGVILNCRPGQNILTLLSHFRKTAVRVEE